MGRGARWPLVLLLLAFFALQLSITPQIFRGTRPEAILLFVACAGLYAGPGWGMGLGLLGGVLEAAFEGYSAGALVLSRAVCGLVGGAIGERAFRENIFVASFAAFVCVWAAEATFGVVSPVMAFTEWLKVTALESAWAVVAGPAVYLLIWLVCGLP